MPLQDTFIDSLHNVYQDRNGHFDKIVLLMTAQTSHVNWECAIQHSSQLGLHTKTLKSADSLDQ